MVITKKIFTIIIFLVSIGFSLEIKINNNLSLNHNLKIYIPTDLSIYKTAYRYMDITLKPIYIWALMFMNIMIIKNTQYYI